MDNSRIRNHRSLDSGLSKQREISFVDEFFSSLPAPFVNKAKEFLTELEQLRSKKNKDKDEIEGLSKEHFRLKEELKKQQLNQEQLMQENNELKSRNRQMEEDIAKLVEKDRQSAKTIKQLMTELDEYKNVDEKKSAK